MFTICFNNRHEFNGVNHLGFFSVSLTLFFFFWVKRVMRWTGQKKSVQNFRVLE